MKHIFAIAASVLLTATASVAQEEMITPVDPTMAVGQTTIINGVTYVAVAVGSLVMLTVLAGSEEGTSSSGTD